MTDAEQKLLQLAMSGAETYEIRRVATEIRISRLEEKAPELVDALIRATQRCRDALDTRARLMEKLTSALDGEEALARGLYDKRWALHIASDPAFKKVADLQSEIDSYQERERQSSNNLRQRDEVLSALKQELGLDTFANDRDLLPAARALKFILKGIGLK